MPIDSEALNSLRRDRSEMPAFQPARNRRTRWVVGAIGLMLLAGALAYWRQSAALLVTVVSVTEGAGGGPASVLNASGYVVARRLATVSSKVTGKVVEVLVEEGMPVTQGQVLARLDDSSARAQYDLRNTQWRSTQKRLEEVKVRLAEAQRQRQRAESLKTRGLVSDGAVATSTKLRRRWRRGDVMLHHLLDPSTGAPADSGLATVTVIAGDAWWAEVLAKAAFVAGPDAGVRLLEESGVEGLLVADDGTVIETAGLAAFRS